MLSHFSRVRLCVTLQTVACQAPLSMGFSRQEYWSGLPFPSPGVLTIEQINPVFLPGQSHGQRSLTGYSPWDHKESDTTEHAYDMNPLSFGVLIIQ